MKVAIIHYWLVGMRGGEKVLEALCELYPDAVIYTHVVDRSKLTAKILSHRIITTFIARLPGAVKNYQKYLPLMPLALEQLDLSDYDLVISSESGPAKGVITRPGSLHICYCHSPMRYIWDQYPLYLNRAGTLVRALFPFLAHRLRIWDVTSAARVDLFVANSNSIAARIKKFYRRDAVVIHPPCEIALSEVVQKDAGYYLMAGQLVGYKRPDLAVAAFNKMGKRLVVAGEGEELQNLKKLAASNVEFVGRVSDEELRMQYAGCEALIFPGEEDFGIVPVEAMSFGKPVIAFGRGGALDTVIEGETGVFFESANIEAICHAVEKYERTKESFHSDVIKNHALKFSKHSFKQKFSELVKSLTAEKVDG